MEIKTFIEKTIEGGYRKLPTWTGFDADLNRQHYFRSMKEDIHKIVLDPKAWEAVGKVEGWKEEINEKSEKGFYGRCSVTGEKVERNPIFWADCLCHREACMKDEAKDKMHKMVDALFEGKSIKDYIETL